MKLCHSALRSGLMILYVLLVLYPLASAAQEKKSLRVVFTGLAWNSELPFRVALARGFFKAQGLEIQPIFVAAVRWLSRRFRRVRSSLPRSAARRRSCAAGPEV